MDIHDVWVRTEPGSESMRGITDHELLNVLIGTIQNEMDARTVIGACLSRLVKLSYDDGYDFASQRS